MHGLSYNPLYKTYFNMIYRCTKPGNNRYKYYGGRGIKVCDRWLGKDGLKNFLDDVGKRPDGYTLDRINRNGDYSPDNCRWSDIYTQNINRGAPSDNTSGRVGVTYEKARRNWRAYISYKGSHHRLGSFGSIEKAIIAREQAEIKFYGKPFVKGEDERRKK